MHGEEEIKNGDKRVLFHLLKNRGIGVDPDNYKAVCIKILNPGIGARYKNEIHRDDSETIVMIKYMMSRNPKDVEAFKKSFKTNTNIRVLLIKDKLDYNCGWWYIEHLELNTSNKYAILKRSTFSHEESHNAHQVKITEKVKEKEKETVYLSNLEKHWGMFFKALGLSFEYEPEKFFLSSGRHYTPDFYLSELDIYIEIKPKVLRCVEHMRKCRMLSSQHNKRVVLLNGDPRVPIAIDMPWDDKTGRYPNLHPDTYTGVIFQNGEKNHPDVLFMEIDGKIDICETTDENTIFTYPWFSPKLKEAYEAISLCMNKK